MKTSDVCVIKEIDESHEFDCKYKDNKIKNKIYAI